MGNEGGEGRDESRPWADAAQERNPGRRNAPLRKKAAPDPAAQQSQGLHSTSAAQCGFLGMVRLNRIYTRTGDDGSTGLGDGTRVPKDQARIVAYGTVDELSSVVGVLRTQPGAEAFETWLSQIQNDLFDVGADLAVPGQADDKLRITGDYVERLEGWIDEANEGLEPLKSFVLPGGNPLSAWLHMARTVCRRAERWMVTLLHEEPDKVGPEPLKYINRLSDLFFVLARQANGAGRDDVLWRPGGQDAR